MRSDSPAALPKVLDFLVFVRAAVEAGLEAAVEAVVEAAAEDIETSLLIAMNFSLTRLRLRPAIRC